MPTFASRMDRIVGSATVGINDFVAQKKREGLDVISLTLGEPDFDTPAHVRQAAKDALDAGHTHYTPGPGIPQLREAIAQTHQRDNQIPCEAKHVLATPTKQAVMMSIIALAGKGDEVMLPDPAWVSYEPLIQWAHAKPVPVPLDANFGATAEAVAEKVTPATKAIILNSPSNPTGGINDAAEIRGIVELAQDHDFWIISDEIYQKLLYDGEHLSPASIDFDRTITIDGLSKSFAMTGWRTGWAVAPTPIFKQINKLQSHSVTQVTSFAQYGAVAALTGPQDSVDEMRQEFLIRRRAMVDGLNAIDGVSCAEPRGAFYAFPKFDGVEDDEKLCMKLIEGGVAGTPGSSFGEGGRGHLRFSYATNVATIEEAVRRIAKSL